jgi:PAS domain-containing protein
MQEVPMSDPTVPTFAPERAADLRSRAASRLTGAAATKGPAARATDALTVLHALASSPATAVDALTLLHELQVYQVELDLQAQELRESRTELESALRRQIELYDHQPAGSFTIDPRRVVLELNQTGADLLGLGRDDAFGLSLDTFLGADGAGWLRSAMSSIDAGTRPASCLLRLCRQGGPDRAVLVSLSADPAAKRYLVSLMDAGDGRPR